MTKKLNKVLLIDDDRPTNFFHEMIIRKMDCADSIESFRGVDEAIAYLKLNSNKEAQFPELIFLDINMPGLDGWDFIEAYKKIDSPYKEHTKIIVLTTSLSPREKQKAKEIPEILDFKNKPLDQELMKEVLEGYFQVVN